MSMPTNEDIDAVLRVMVKCGIIRVKGKDPKTGETMYIPNPKSGKDCDVCRKDGLSCPLLDN